MNNMRINPLGIQMLPEHIYHYLFGNVIPIPSTNNIEQSIQHLKQHGITTTTTTQQSSLITIKDNLKLPELWGDNIKDHFNNIANYQVKDYRQLIDELTRSITPHIPNSWCYQPGWTRYDSNGDHYSVDYPDDNVLVFDVEVCTKYDHLPILATAVSPQGWYSWISNKLYYNNDYNTINSTPDDLITIGQSINNKRLIIGHNVSYDRARIREEYNINVSN